MAVTTTVIGRNELVDIVDHPIKHVPAKIDTGADSCAIWATDVKESNGMLTFSLFGAGSVYYSGQKHKTDHYKVTSVKNSFGKSELRHTVWLSVQLAGKRYKVRFNLADRSHNHFPILLGKRFLNKKFLVDVSRNYILTAPEKPLSNKRVLVLTTNPSLVAKGFFKDVAKGFDGSVEVCGYDELVFTIDEHPSVVIANSQTDLADYDLVYFKSRKSKIEQAMAVASYLRYKNVIYRDEELDYMISHSKLSEMMELATHALSVPKASIAPTNYLLENIDQITKQISFPLVLKDVFSDRGNYNYLVKDKAELQKLLHAAPGECLFAVQKFIPNEGFLRVMVLGKEVTMAVKRTAVRHKDPQKSHLNKPAGSTNATLVEPVDLEVKVISLSLRAAEVMRRQVAGIDILQDKASGKWYILEVNSGPQLYSKNQLITQRKISVLADYFKHELERW